MIIYFCVRWTLHAPQVPQYSTSFLERWRKARRRTAPCAWRSKLRSPRTEPHDPCRLLTSASKSKDKANAHVPPQKSRCANSKRRAKTRDRIVPQTWFALLTSVSVFQCFANFGPHALSLSLSQSKHWPFSFKNYSRCHTSRLVQVRLKKLRSPN